MAFQKVVPVLSVSYELVYKFIEANYISGTGNFFEPVNPNLQYSFRVNGFRQSDIGQSYATSPLLDRFAVGLTLGPPSGTFR